MNRAAAVVAGGVVVAVVAGIAAYAIMKDGEETRTLVLTGTPENCTTTDPGVLGNRKGKNVQWTIQNNCGAEQYVQFQNFRRRHLNDGGYDPADNSVVSPYPPGRSVAAGASMPLTARIEKGPKWVVIIDTYKYDVYLGPNAGSLRQVLDPDVEIWP